MLNYKSMAHATSRRRAALQSKVAATKESLEAMEAELRLLDGILKALPKTGGVGSSGKTSSGRRSAGRRSTGRRSAGRRSAARRSTTRRSATPSPAKPRGKWRPGRPGRPPKWYLEQKAAQGGTPSGKRSGRKSARTPSGKPGRVVRGKPAPRPPRAKRPPSEKQLAALAKARAARAAKRAAGGAEIPQAE